MTDIDAIVRMIHKGGLDCAYDDDVVKAREQLYALVANKIKGLCKDCDISYKSDGDLLTCGNNGDEKDNDDYCSYFTARQG